MSTSVSAWQIFNPPYAPTPHEEVNRGGIASAWAGGDRGRVVIDRVLAQVGGFCVRVWLWVLADG